MRPIGTIVLAAGESKRMGKPKQLLPVGDHSLILHTLSVIEGAERPYILVVLGAHSDEIERELADHPVGIYIHKDWRLGMGSSLKAGLEHVVEAHPEITGLLVCVCDQPMITSDHIKTLVDAFQGGEFDAVASSYSGAIGAPAIFSRKLFPDIRKLGDEDGARTILRKPGSNVRIVPLVGGEVDLDTPADYESFMKGQTT